MTESNRPCAATWSVEAYPDPSVLSRLLELFAKRNLVPDRVECVLQATNDPRLATTISLTGPDAALAAYIGRCMQEMVYVDTVEVTIAPVQQPAPRAAA